MEISEELYEHRNGENNAQVVGKLTVSNLNKTKDIGIYKCMLEIFDGKLLKNRLFDQIDIAKIVGMYLIQRS